MDIKVCDVIGNRATDMEQGDKIYNIIVGCFKQGEKVRLDFNNMITILSAFLNNAIGALYKDYDSAFLKDNLEILGLHEDDMFILNRVIKRAKEFYANEEVITDLLDERMID